MPTRTPQNPADKKPEPALRSSPKCPACGREPAVVFEVVQSADGQPVESHQVCLDCCPKVPNGSE